MKKVKLTIRMKYLIVTMLLFSVFILVSFRIWYQNFYQAAKSSSIENVETIVTASNTTFETYLKDINNIMTLISLDTGSDLNANILKILSDPYLTDAEYVTFCRTATNYISGLCSFKSYLVGLSISDFSGNDITYGTTKSYHEVRQEDWFWKIQTGSTDSLLFIPAQNTEEANNYHNTFTMVRTVKSGSKTIGFVMAHISYKIFDDYFNINPNSNINLLVLDTSSNEALLRLNENNVDIWQELIQDDITYLKTEENKMITAEYYYPYDEIITVSYTSPMTGWTTIGGISKSEMMYDFYQTIQKLMLITVIISIAALIAIYVVSSLLTSNILKLTAAVKSIGKDHLSFELVIRSNDEIHELQQQFQFMVERIQNLISDIKTTEHQKHQFEMRALQAQINPHFLHNTLNTIQFLSDFQGADNIKEISNNLSKMLRINMDNRTMISIQEEISYLNQYLEIQSYRYMNCYSSNIICEEGLAAYFIPKLLIQPIVENSLKYGIVNKNNGIILVKIYKMDQKIHIKVSDNGVGMPENIQQFKSPREHIGLYNINQRLLLYFGSEYGLTIESETGLYTNIELTIPFITEIEVKQYA